MLWAEKIACETMNFIMYVNNKLCLIIVTCTQQKRGMKVQALQVNKDSSFK